MNYLAGFSGFGGCCCALGTSDDIKIYQASKFVDAETNKIMDDYVPDYVEGHTYVYQKVWVITKGCTVLKSFFDKDEAYKCFNNIVEELKTNNKVIELK